MTSIFRLLLSFLIFLTVSASAQEAPPVLHWQKAIGSNSSEAANKLISAIDGGFLVAATKGNDSWVIKMDDNSNIMWQTVLGGSGQDVAVSVTQVAQGNIYVAGYTSSSAMPGYHGGYDFWLVALSSDGTFLWQKTYGGSNVEMARSIIATADGNLVMAGSTMSKNGDITEYHGSEDFWIVKVDTDGNMLWQKSFGGSGSDICNALIENTDMSLIAIGGSTSVDKGSAAKGGTDVWAIQMDANGALQWEKTFGGSKYENAFDIIRNNAGDFVIAGYTASNDGDVQQDTHGGTDFWMIIIDAAGNLLSNSIYGGSNSDIAFSLSQSTDGGYIMAGATTSSDLDIKKNHGGEDFCVIKTDPSGVTKWSRTYGGSGNDRALSVLPNSDGGFIIAGYSYSNDQDVQGNHGSGDIWINQQSCLAPQSLFTVADSVCIHTNVALTNNSVNSAEFTWLQDGIAFVPNEGTVELSTAGYHTVELVAATCYVSDKTQATIRGYACGLPTAYFTTSANSVCQNSCISFSDMSTGATSWSWSFPGAINESSTEQNPTACYATPGVYDVILTVTNADGSTSMTRNSFITVNAAPDKPVVTAGGTWLLSTSAVSYQWFFNNVMIPNATSQDYTATEEGYYYVVVENAAGCSSQSDPVLVKMLSVGQPKASVDFKMYPNPANDVLNISTSMDWKSMEIVDVAGKVIMHYENVTGSKSFDIASLKTGLYLVSITSGQNISDRYPLVISR